MALITDLVIQKADQEDWPMIRAIYLEGIRTGHATFTSEAEVPQAAANWFEGKSIVLKGLLQETMVGWAALSPSSKRYVYRGVQEVSLYVSQAHKGQGIGKRLLAELVKASEEAGLWTLYASIFPENEVSLKLHYDAGFKLLGRREKIGQMEGRWRDTLFLERRSPLIV
ncbi:MAG: N-acetyltransferase family protein [Deinococcales bacterium]